MSKDLITLLQAQTFDIINLELNRYMECVTVSNINDDVITFYAPYEEYYIEVTNKDVENYTIIGNQLIINLFEKKY